MATFVEKSTLQRQRSPARLLSASPDHQQQPNQEASGTNLNSLETLSHHGCSIKLMFATTKVPKHWRMTTRYSHKHNAKANQIVEKHDQQHLNH